MGTRNWNTLLDPWSTFGPVMRGQMPNFRKIGKFSTLEVRVSKTTTRGDMKYSP